MYILQSHATDGHRKDDYKLSIENLLLFRLPRLFLPFLYSSSNYTLSSLTPAYLASSRSFYAMSVSFPFYDCLLQPAVSSFSFLSFFDELLPIFPYLQFSFCPRSSFQFSSSLSNSSFFTLILVMSFISTFFLCLFSYRSQYSLSYCLFSFFLVTSAIARELRRCLLSVSTNSGPKRSWQNKPRPNSFSPDAGAAGFRPIYMYLPFVARFYRNMESGMSRLVERGMVAA